MITYDNDNDNNLSIDKCEKYKVLGDYPVSDERKSSA
jgi:hypothetical protein